MNPLRLFDFFINFTLKGNSCSNPSKMPTLYYVHIYIKNRHHMIWSLSRGPGRVKLFLCSALNMEILNQDINIFEKANFFLNNIRTKKDSICIWNKEMASFYP